MFATADGASAFERARKAYEDMSRGLPDGEYKISSKVSVRHDYFPILTDVLDDGLRYEMGFTLFVNGTDAGRVGRYALERPNKATFYTDDMIVSVRVRGLSIGRIGDGRRG